MQAVSNLGAAAQAGTTSSSKSVQDSSDSTAQSFLETLQSASSDAGIGQDSMLATNSCSASESAKTTDGKSGNTRKRNSDDTADNEPSAAVVVQDQSLSVSSAVQGISAQTQSEAILTTPLELQNTDSTVASGSVSYTEPVASETTTRDSFVLPTQSADMQIAASDDSEAAQQTTAPTALNNDLNVAQQGAENVSASNVSASSELQGIQHELSNALAEIQSSVVNCNDVDNQPISSRQSQPEQPTVNQCSSEASATQPTMLGQSSTLPSGEVIVSMMDMSKTTSVPVSQEDAAKASSIKDEITEHATAFPGKNETALVTKKQATVAAPKQDDSVYQVKQQAVANAVGQIQQPSAQSGNDAQQSLNSDSDGQKKLKIASQESSSDEKVTTHDLSVATGQEISTPAASITEQKLDLSAHTNNQPSADVSDSKASQTITQDAANQISSAKLIQSASKTEMRVGMQSSEFGNISISASSTRDSITAQISVDHTELAKTLSSQLSDFQTKSNDGQLNIQVNMHGSGSSTTSNQSNGGQTGTMGGSASQSNSNAHQSSQIFGRNSTATAVKVEPEVTAGLVAAQFGKQSANVNGRLDVSA